MMIIEKSATNSYSLPGEPITDAEFENWVENAENSPTVDLNEAEQQWTSQKEKTQKHIG
jgi:hypothetical protein